MEPHSQFIEVDDRIALKCPAEIEAQLFANTMSLDIFSQVVKIDCPALVLRGAYTDEPLSVVAERVARQIPHSSLVTVPDTGHFLAMEKPEEVAEIIGEYFRAG